MKIITFSIMQTRIPRKHFMLNIASKGWFSLVMESEKSGYFFFHLLLHLNLLILSLKVGFVPCIVCLRLCS